MDNKKKPCSLCKGKGFLVLRFRNGSRVLCGRCSGEGVVTRNPQPAVGFQS